MSPALLPAGYPGSHNWLEKSIEGDPQPPSDETLQAISTGMERGGGGGEGKEKEKRKKTPLTLVFQSIPGPLC